MKNPWVIIAVLTVVLFGGAYIYSSQVNEGTNEDYDSSINTTALTESQIKGNPDSEVKLVEYSDFQCPACAQFYPVVKELLDKYGDQISFEYRHFPLIQNHPFAEPAARAAVAAGIQGKFYEYHDILFERQSQWSTALNPNRMFSEYATELGLDVNQFEKQMRSSDIRDKVKNDLQDGFAAGVTGTPSFYLNGEKLQLTTLGDLMLFTEQALGVNAGLEIDSEIEVDAGPGVTASPAALPEPEVKFGI